MVRKGWTVMTTTRSVGMRIQGSTTLRGVARSILIAVAVCSIALPSFATTDQLFDKTYPLAAGGNFQLDNINGSVQVEGWDRDEVEVSAVKTADNDPHDLDQVQIDVDSQPGQVTVHTRYPTSEGTGVTVE